MKDKVQGMSQRDPRYPKDSPFAKKRKGKKSKNPKNSSGKDAFESSEKVSNALSYADNPKLKPSILKKINAPSSSQNPMDLKE